MAIPAASYTGQRRAPPRQWKSGFGIAVALVLADSLFGALETLFPQIPDSPRESPRFGKIADAERHLAHNKGRTCMTLELYNPRQTGARLPAR